ncbi:unnamed protein product, partial [Ectocarpus sp. 12 AP-2014]
MEKPFKDRTESVTGSTVEMPLSNRAPPPGISTPRSRPHEHILHQTNATTPTHKHTSTFLAAVYSRPTTERGEQAVSAFLLFRPQGSGTPSHGHLLLLDVHVGIPAAVPPPRVELPRREHRHPPQQERVGGLHLLPLLPAGGARAGAGGGGGSPLFREHDLLELSRAPRPAPGDGAGRRQAREITAASANDDAQNASAHSAAPAAGGPAAVVTEGRNKRACCRVSAAARSSRTLGRRSPGSLQVDSAPHR